MFSLRSGVSGINTITPFRGKRISRVHTNAYDIIHEPFPIRHHLEQEMEHVHFLKAQNTTVFSESYIRWAMKHGDNISVCIHPDGCSVHEMFEVSKEKNPDDYQYLVDLLGFEDKDNQ